MSEEQSAVIPHRAEIRCNNYKDEYVQEFISHFRFKKLQHEVIVEEREDIDIKFFDERSPQSFQISNTCSC